MEEVSPKVPSVKIVLFGPKNTGKTTFKKILLEGGVPSSDYQPTTRTEIKDVMRQFYKKMANRYVPTETYKLLMADTPGAPEHREERYKGIQKSVGIILFYDSTNPQSAKELSKMVSEEILKPELYYNLMGIVLVATKKDLGANIEAVKLVQSELSEFSSVIKNLWGYDIPHLVISCMDPNEVGWAFYILEALIMDKPPHDIIRTLSVENLGVPSTQTEMPQIQPQPEELTTAKTPETPVQVSKPVEEKKPTLTPTTEPKIGDVAPEATVRGEQVELKKEELLFEEEKPKVEVGPTIKLHPSEKIWLTLEKLVNSKADEIVEAIFFRKTADVLYVAFYPGEKRLDERKRKVILESLKIEEVGDTLSYSYDIRKPQLYLVYGEDKSALVVKRRDALLIVKVRGFPSKELINLLV